MFALKPLEGGRISPEKAFRYLFHELDIPTTMIRLGSMDEVAETFGATAEVLTTKSLFHPSASYGNMISRSSSSTYAPT